jgi:hypothetical protein
MHGMRRLRSESECVECHLPAATLPIKWSPRAGASGATSRC